VGFARELRVFATFHSPLSTFHSPLSTAHAMPNGSSRSQTLSLLMRRFKEAGFQPRAKLGQCFLIDRNLQELLVRSAALGPDDVVLEVGTGTGTLTALLAAEAAAVVTVEFDRRLFQLAAEELYELDNVKMLQLDVLENKNRLNPAVMQAVCEQLAAAPNRQFKLVANLPYNVATPIIANLLARDAPPRMMIVTIQKELADRITARPGTKDYGALSIWVQSQCRVRVIRVMPPAVFWPRPKVFSAIIAVTLADDLGDRIVDREFFHKFVRSMFFHRRKFLRSQLHSAMKNRLGKPDLDRILARMGIDGTARAEQLDVDTMLALAENLRAELDN